MNHTTFYWGRQVTLMVDCWRTTTWLGYSLTLLVCLLASASYQYLENRRRRLKVLTSAAVPIQEPFLQSKIAGGKWLPARIAGAMLFGFNTAIEYLLMLSVMSFNGGVFLAVVFGLAIGYFLFN